MVEYLLQITNMQNWKASNNNVKENDTLVQIFKKNIKDVFEIWWKKQAIITGENKLDFYYKYKTSFQYEKYLDNIPRHIRIHITRLRTSSHILPIEVQRYNNTNIDNTKTKRQDRKCEICTLNEMGDEDHYLLRCNNNEMNITRHNFICNIRKEIPQLQKFSEKNIIDYCMNMSDENIQVPMGRYIRKNQMLEIRIIKRL